MTRSQTIFILLLLTGASACSDETAPSKSGVSDGTRAADTRYAFFLYQNKLGEKLGLGEDERKELDRLADPHRNVVEVENGGPKKKFSTIPFAGLKNASSYVTNERDHFAN